jgi:transcriptional regulator with XRE-family HTH domain
MGKKPSEISKWLNGEHNFTLRSLAKLEAELGEPIITVPKWKSLCSGFSQGPFS